MSDQPRELSVEEIRALLVELGRRLHTLGLRSTLYLVGGAAIAMTINERRVTADVDGIFESSETIIRLIAEIGDERGLRPDWLNQNARMALPLTEDEPDFLFEVSGLAVTTASPEHLLAMKLAADRPQDADDLKLLFNLVGIQTPEEAVDLAYDVYGGADNSYIEVFGTGRDDFLLRARSVLDAIARDQNS